MAVLAAKRKESRFEPIVQSEVIHQMLVELMQHSFGIKNMDTMVRRQYIAGKCERDAYWRYCYLLRNAKVRIDRLAAELTCLIRAANTIYPVTIHEYEKRRDNQNYAIIVCEQLLNELQHIVEIFDVDINLYKRHIQAIEREIALIKKWRQSDNRLKARLQGSD